MDLIYRPVEKQVTDATLADSMIRPVDAIAMPVVSAVVPLPGDARTRAPNEVEEIS